MESTSVIPSETLSTIAPKYSEQSFDFEGMIIYGTGNKKSPPFMLMLVGDNTDEMTEKLSQQNNLLQSEMRKLHAVPRALDVKQIVTEEEEYYKNTYGEEVSPAAKVALDHVAAKIAEVDFKKITVEFTLLNTAIFRLELRDDTTLFITVPLTEHKNLGKIEVVYSLFVEGEKIVSNYKNLNEVLEGAKELIGQRVEFTTA